MEKTFRILVVDDDPDTARAYGQLLSALDVESAPTAEAGLERLRHGPPVHCVVLDLNLPNGCGLALIRRYREAAPDVPLVVLTGYSYEPSEIYIAGAHGFFTKPAAPHLLMDAIARAIGEQHAAQRLESCRAELAEMWHDLEQASRRRQERVSIKTLRLRGA